MPAVNKPRQLVGVFLLIVVNMVLVACSEISKHLFNDLNFKRPFFMTYVKSCMFTVFLLRYAFNSPTKHPSKTCAGEASYAKLETNLSDEEYEVESLTTAEFESITSDLDSDDFERTATEDESINNNISSILSFTNESLADAKLIPDFNDDITFKCIGRDNSTDLGNTLTGAELTTVVEDGDKLGEHVKGMKTLDRKSNVSKKISSSTRRVRFSLFREVRRFPERIQRDAKLARLSYRPKMLQWTCSCRTMAKKAAICASNNGELLSYCLYFAPLRFLSSIGYQLALSCAIISSVNIISALSSIFVLVLGALVGNRSSDRFTLLKFGLLLLNLGGVAIVTQFSVSFLGAAAAFSSALAYAGYLLLFTYTTTKYGHIDINLMFGVMGVFSVLLCTPLIFILHGTGVESQSPAPTAQQWTLVIVKGAMESLVADFLLLRATLFTNPLLASFSLTLAIPFSMVANATFRGQQPDTAQVFASISTLISFFGISLIHSSPTPIYPSSFSAAQDHRRTSPCVSYFCDRCFGVRIMSGVGSEDSSSSSSSTSTNNSSSSTGDDSFTATTTELSTGSFSVARKPLIRRDSLRVLMEVCGGRGREGHVMTGRAESLLREECAEDVRLIGAPSEDES